MIKYLDDLLILLGCGLIVFATYRISFTAALYVGGFFLLAGGLLIGISRRGVKK